MVTGYTALLGMCVRSRTLGGGGEGGGETVASKELRVRTYCTVVYSMKQAITEC